jgi:tRNA 2-thiouridine synthesizing protein C
MNTKKSKKILFVLRHAPYGNSLAKEALDAILATSAYNQELSIAFIDDGVFQLVKSQQAEQIGEKNFLKILSAFPLYDITNLFVCSASLQERGLKANAIIDNVSVIDSNTLNTLLQQQDHLLSF